MLKNIAVLIDADNVNSQKFDWILQKIQSFGTMTTKRIYGDFAKTHLSSWESSILKYAIEKKHQTSYSTGKNSSDIALTIDAMDLLHAKKCDGFCIISSDSDFIGLALRIRRANMPVYGFGNANSIKEFRQACTEFFEIPSVKNTNTTEINNANQPKTIENKKLTANQLKCDTKLLKALRESISNNKADENGWVNYAIFSSYLQKHHPSIKAENYGYAKFYEIIDQIDLFEGKKENSTIFIRYKPSKNQSNNKSNVNQPCSKEKLLKDTRLINAIKESIAKNLDNGWTNFSPFTQYLNTNYPKIKPKNYGYAKWRSLMNKLELFEFKQGNKKTLWVREKSNSQTTNTIQQTKKISNQKLLDDIAQIINENPMRKDEWTHIGYLGSQLKQMGYHPKDFGVKTFTLLLRSLNGIENKIVSSTDYFTLTDKSKIKPIAKQTNTETANFTNTRLYAVLKRNEVPISNQIKKMLEKNGIFEPKDLWLLLSPKLPNEILLPDNQSYECFEFFIKTELNL